MFLEPGENCIQAADTGSPSDGQGPVWALTGESVCDWLSVDPERGLGPSEVQSRRARCGPNRLTETATKTLASIIIEQFRSLVVGLLLVAGAVSFAFGDIAEGIAISVVLLLNAAIGAVTESKAVRSMEALRRMGHAQVTVLREGRRHRIDAEGLVPGDIVSIEGGDVVTADMRLLSASRLLADESTLTGESTPVQKSVEPVGSDTLLADRTPMLFKGTSITRGSGAAIVTSTGMNTELGHVTELVRDADEGSTPLQERLDAMGRRLVWVTVGMAVAIGVAGVLTGRDLLLTVQTAIALAVAAIPEGLLIVATLALARGMLRMARRNALVERLSAVETLGSTNVILTDKTGTLTENSMAVRVLGLPGGDLYFSGSGASPGQPDAERLLRTAVLCNEATLGSEKQGLGDPMEVALLEAGARWGLRRETLLAGSPLIATEAFDPDLKMMATFHRGEHGGVEVAVKGAPEAVLSACSLEEAVERRWLKRVDELGSRGMRVIAAAMKESPATGDPYRGLTFLGLIGLMDPPRHEVGEALESCRKAGIRVIMVTGDHAGTARAIATELGLYDGGRVVTGAELQPFGEMPQATRSRLRSKSVFARISPEQKLTILQLHKEAGDVVAMLGDGVNDAPALRRADIGVAMGRRGTEVAKEASAMVLRDDRFETIVAAIAQGRVIFDNIRRFVVYLLSCNLAEILVVGLGTVADVPLPLLPLQILFINLVTDVFPALALGTGDGSEEVLDRPPRPPGEDILTGTQWSAIAGYGVTMAAAVLASLVVSRTWLGYSADQAVTISFLTLAFAQLWHVFNMTEPGSGVVLNEISRNRWIWAALGLCSALLLIAVYVPSLARILDIEPPGPSGWSLIAGLSLVPLVAGRIVHSWRGRSR